MVLNLPILQPFNKVHVVLTPTIRLFSALFHSYNHSTAVNHKVNIFSRMVLGNPVKGSFDTQRRHDSVVRILVPLENTEILWEYVFILIPVEYGAASDHPQQLIGLTL